MKTGFGGPSFTARYISECADCGNDIEPGDEAMYDEDDQVVHVHCPDKPLKVSVGKACPDCWLVHPKGSECP